MCLRARANPEQTTVWMVIVVVRKFLYTSNDYIGPENLGDSWPS